MDFRAPILDGESIVVAIGQADDHSLDQRGQGIFAGGDMVSGPSTVIQAVASAQETVREIEKFLNEGPAFGQTRHCNGICGILF